MLLDRTLHFKLNSQSFSTLFISTNKVIIVGDVNIHVAVDNDRPSTAVISQLDSVGFAPSVNKPTHSSTILSTLF